jgi:glycosyltransferase involved in cell wall biosynthesis
MRLLLFNLVLDADHPVLGFTTLWTNALAQHYQHIDVLTMQQGRLDVAANVSVYSVGRERGFSEPRRAIEFYRVLARLLRENRYDACFAHMQPLFALMAWPLLRVRGVPITLWYAHKHIPLRVRLAEKVVDHIVTSSLEGFRLPSRKVTVVGQGIDTTLFTPHESVSHMQRPFTIISLGRVVPVKRLEIIIEAMRLLAGHDVRLHIVGDGDAVYLQKLRQQVDEYGLNACVVFDSGVPYSRVAERYQHADVMANVSATGSIDKAVLEAMACALPVITANEAFTTILHDWRDQLLIPHDADAMARLLAERLQSIIALPQHERRALGLQLRQRVVEQHSLDRLTHNLVQVMSR